MTSSTSTEIQPCLIPSQPGATPNYFCTWNVQGYICSYASPEAQRAAMRESNLFGSSPDTAWVSLFERIQGDLLFVLDDSWDVPLDGNRAYFGSLELDQERFPSYEGTPAQRLGKLVDEVKQQGWRGLGGWLCVQQAPIASSQDEPTYWRERLTSLAEAGLTYLKADWGRHEHDANWRRQFTLWCREYAPQIIVEHALAPAAIAFSDVYRTYDVELIISIPETIRRLAELLALPAAQGSDCILNCEDEVLVGAALGCALGIMRHPFVDHLPNGQQDFCFPPTCRDVKRRMDEVTRAILWQRIAPPFGVGETNVLVDDSYLQDHWNVQPNETWVSRANGDVVTSRAPIRVARGLSRLPHVELPAGSSETPYVLASRHPNGALAVATLGRSLRRRYECPRAHITIEVEKLQAPIGVFGYFQDLTLLCADLCANHRILAQDMLSTFSRDITEQVHLSSGKLVIPGEVIDSIGLESATPGDLSEPGLCLLVKDN